MQLVYENGASTTESTSRSFGLFGSTKGIGLGSARTKTKGKSISTLAQKAAPPAKLPYKFYAICLFIAYLLLAESSLFGGWFILGLLMLAVSCFFLYFSYRFNKNNWPQKYKEWQALWLCHKCGHTYCQQPKQ